MSSPRTIVVAEAATGAMLWRHLRMIARLGAPVSLSRAAGLMLFVVDTAMVGHFSSTELAYFGLANAVQMVLMLVGIGMLVGTAVLAAQALGAGQPGECGPVWRVAMVHAIGLGVFFYGLSFLGETFFIAIGQDPVLSDGAGRNLMFLAAGLPGQLAFVASTLFLEALGRPRPGLWVMIAANLVNAGLNWLLIFGHWGLPAMGADGAALATAVVRWGIAGALFAYIMRMDTAGEYGVRGPLSDAGAIGRKLRRLGYPLGLAQGLESMAFASLTLMAGYLGAEAVAGFQINMNIVAFCFMGAIGVGTATAVRVGHAVGRGDRRDMAFAGWSGLLAILIYMAVLAIVMALLPQWLAGLFTVDERVLTVAAATLLVSALTLLPDGAQGVLMGALRGTGDVWVPSAMHLCSFAVVMVPGAWLFAFRLEMGVPGLMLGSLAGVSVASVLLSLRFRVVSGRDVKRL
jgi:MATE family multidrug resistance protein